MVVDNSHGKNGPFNTFFRNRAELYGLIVSASQDSQNLIANEITNTNVIMGQFILQGNGHLSINNTIKSKLQSNSNIDITESSFYLTNKPAFLPQQIDWPILGYPQEYNNGLNGAKIRFRDSLEKSYCFTINYPTNIRNEFQEQQPKNFYPNPFNSAVKFIGYSKAVLKIYNSIGQLIMSGAIESNNEINTEKWSPGIYLFILNDNESWKLIKT